MPPWLIGPHTSKMPQWALVRSIVAPASYAGGPLEREVDPRRPRRGPVVPDRAGAERAAGAHRHGATPARLRRARAPTDRSRATRERRARAECALSPRDRRSRVLGCL